MTPHETIQDVIETQFRGRNFTCKDVRSMLTPDLKEANVNRFMLALEMQGLVERVSDRPVMFRYLERRKKFKAETSQWMQWFITQDLSRQQLRRSVK
jgi:hypothetical protein